MNQWKEGNAGRQGENDAKNDNHHRAAAVAGDGTKRTHSYHQTWNSSQQQQTKITRMDVAPDRLYRRSDEPQYTGQNNCGSPRLTSTTSAHHSHTRHPAP